MERFVRLASFIQTGSDIVGHFEQIGVPLLDGVAILIQVENFLRFEEIPLRRLE